MSYFLEKGIKNRNQITAIISRILKFFTVIETNEAILSKALLSKIKDYEDAVIETSALEKDIDYIITKNIDDFGKSKVKALLPVSYLDLFAN